VADLKKALELGGVREDEVRRDLQEAEQKLRESGEF
jgi:hypothetical protein